MTIIEYPLEHLRASSIMMKIVRLLLIFSVLIFRSSTLSSGQTKSSIKYESASSYAVHGHDNNAQSFPHTSYVTDIQVDKSTPNEEKANDIMNSLLGADNKTEDNRYINGDHDNDENDLGTKIAASKLDKKETTKEQKNAAMNAFVGSDYKPQYNPHHYDDDNREIEKTEHSLILKPIDLLKKTSDVLLNKDKKADLKSSSQFDGKTEADKINQAPSLNLKHVSKVYESYFEPENRSENIQKEPNDQILFEVDRTDNKADLKSSSQFDGKTEADKINQAPSLDLKHVSKVYESYFEPDHRSENIQKEPNDQILFKVDRTDNKSDLKSSSQFDGKTEVDKINQAPSLNLKHMSKVYESYFEPDHRSENIQKEPNDQILFKVDRTDLGMIKAVVRKPERLDQSTDLQENDPQSELIINLATKLHNDLRKLHNSPPLTYNSTIARISQLYADKLARRAIEENNMHNPESRKNKFGENIDAYQDSGFNCRQAVETAINGWYTMEIDNYDFESLKHKGTVGHFTQLVWKSSSQFGIGVGIHGNLVTVVANYVPNGNRKGHYEENVLPPIEDRTAKKAAT